jgi:hypothetical protein
VRSGWERGGDSRLMSGQLVRFSNSHFLIVRYISRRCCIISSKITISPPHLPS